MALNLSNFDIQEKNSGKALRAAKTIENLGKWQIAGLEL